MNIFNLRSNDVYDFDRYVDLTKPGYGGPKEVIKFDAKKPKFEKWQHIVKRNTSSENGIEHPNYDSAWKAFTSDLIHKQEKIKAGEIRHAIPTVGTTEVKEDKNKTPNMNVTDKLLNEGRIALFEEFQEMQKEAGLPGAPANLLEPDNLPKEEYKGPEVDEEKLELLLENFGETIESIVADVIGSMELEKEEVADLLCAALIKLCKPELEEEGEDGEKKKDKKEGGEGEKPKKKRRRPKKKPEGGLPGAAPAAPAAGPKEEKKPEAPKEPKEPKAEGGEEKKKGGFPFAK